MLKRGIAISILLGANAAWAKGKKRTEIPTATADTSTSTTSSVTAASGDSAAAIAPQTAHVEMSMDSDEISSSKMANDYNGYFYSTSGNVPEY